MDMDLMTPPMGPSSPMTITAPMNTFNGDRMCNMIQRANLTRLALSASPGSQNYVPMDFRSPPSGTHFPPMSPLQNSTLHALPTEGLLLPPSNAFRAMTPPAIHQPDTIAWLRDDECVHRFPQSPQYSPFPSKQSPPSLRPSLHPLHLNV